MKKISFKIEDAEIEAVFLSAPNPTQSILFTAGSGGNPERHLPLLNSFAERGWTVIAPYFERIVTPFPSADELLSRENGLVVALDYLAEMRVPIVGVGHSIGATLLLALAGGQMWLRPGELLPIQKEDRIKKLVLFTPPTGYFQAPNALVEVQTPIQVWGGSLDVITPVDQMEILRTGLSPKTLVDFRFAEGAGHFSFMNTLPPNVKDHIEDRESFLLKLSEEVCRFAKL